MGNRTPAPARGHNLQNSRKKLVKSPRQSAKPAHVLQAQRIPFPSEISAECINPLGIHSRELISRYITKHSSSPRRQAVNMPSIPSLPCVGGPPSPIPSTWFPFFLSNDAHAQERPLVVDVKRETWRPAGPCKQSAHANSWSFTQQDMT